MIDQAHTSVLSYSTPAETWNEALPIGNGRLGAMVYGRTAKEMIQLNEDSVYSGGRQERTPNQACKDLPELRRLIREGEHDRAEELVNLAFIPTPSSQRHYEPLATVEILFGSDEIPITCYQRSLDLFGGVASTMFERDGVQWCRELIASYEHDVIIVRIWSSRKSSFVVRLSRRSENEWDTNEFCDTIGKIEDKLVIQSSSGGAGGIKSCCALTVQCDSNGSSEIIGGSIVVDAKETFIILAAQTTFRHIDPVAVASSDIDNALQRYEFNGEQDSLNGEPYLEKMLPVVEGAVAFLLDFLIRADASDRYLTTCPSLSPENSYWTFNASGAKVKGTLCEGSTMDIEIIRALFQAYLTLTDDPGPTTANQFSLRSEVQKALPRLPPLKISPDGRLLEWQHPYPEPEPGHRHFSHLFPLYPGTAITLSQTPDLASACRKTLQNRLAEGGAHTGWSRAWLICLYARLQDGEECLEHLGKMLDGSTLPNLFSDHPPMQIDGNFGACAGILEIVEGVWKAFVVAADLN
ncbi:hypothetical protein MBLNU13_g01360t2 [Cladosporium sp. NU13]